MQKHIIVSGVLLGRDKSYYKVVRRNRHRDPFDLCQCQLRRGQVSWEGVKSAEKEPSQLRRGQVSWEGAKSVLCRYMTSCFRVPNRVANGAQFLVFPLVLRSIVVILKCRSIYEIWTQEQKSLKVSWKGFEFAENIERAFYGAMNKLPEERS